MSDPDTTHGMDTVSIDQRAYAKALVHKAGTLKDQVYDLHKAVRVAPQLMDARRALEAAITKLESFANGEVEF